MESSEIKDWYNNVFAKKQVKTGINLRHYKIIHNLIDAGLQKNHNVLEVGCGIGTLTELLLKYLKRGAITATDISDKSIEIAQSKLLSDKVKFVVTDMRNFVTNEKFDFIVLPDVLEHIPMDQHENLFRIFSEITHEKSHILINIPHPKLIDYYKRNNPKSLQIIDQALPANFILNNAYKYGFSLIKYEPYPIFNKMDEYVNIVFKNEYSFEKLNPFSTFDKIRRKQLARLRFLFS